MTDISEDTLTAAGPEATWGNAEPISSADDLPEPENGFHDLSELDNRAYLFTESVSSDAGLRLGANTPLVGWHGGVSLFNYTGEKAAIKADGVPCFMDGVTVTCAPDAQHFDLQGGSAVEHLVTECSFVGGGLGRIEGYRVPSFKTCNFEAFSSGFSLTGSSKKLLFKDCPFRSVSSSGVKILDFKSDLSTEVVVLAGNYIKDVESDTVVAHVASGAMPDVVFQYTGNTHGAAVTKSNILTGEVSTETPGVNVTSSSPLRDSGSGGEYEFTSPPNTTTISSAGTPVKIEGATTVQNAERFEQNADNEFTYVGRTDTEKEIVARASVQASNTTGQVYLALNGTVQGNGVDFETQGSSSPIPVTVGKRFKLSENDTVSVYIENSDGTGDLDVTALSVVA